MSWEDIVSLCTHTHIHTHTHTYNTCTLALLYGISSLSNRKGCTTQVQCTPFCWKAMFLQEWAIAMNMNVPFYQCRLCRSGPMVSLHKQDSYSFHYETLPRPKKKASYGWTQLSLRDTEI